jgi:outer membrane protein OmpA-like peptidoglycan-associated protein
MNRTLLAALGLGLMVGCGSSRPPNQLIDARIAYQRATQNPGAPAVATDLYDARTALDTAERSFADDGDSDKTKSLAYVAHRRAIAVEGKAQAVAALESKRTAEAQLQAFQQQQAVATRQQLDRTKGQLTAAQQQAEAERQARTAAENKTQELLGQIEGIKTAQTERGLMLTLSGSVLFASGKSQLLPTSKRRLADVAKALKEDKRSMIVVGHTDATGSDEKNRKLSEDRANAVRHYLVSQGIEDKRIRAEGMGETQPIADNTSPEGRANNRRVEIILENMGGAGGMGTPSSGGMQQGGGTMQQGGGTMQGGTMQGGGTQQGGTQQGGTQQGGSTTPPPPPRK